MEPVEIDIKTAPYDALYAECVRLGIPVTRTTAARRIRDKLRNRARAYASFYQWLQLAIALYGPHHGLPTYSLAVIQSGVYNRLFDRLQHEGYAGNKPITDPATQERFVITRRLNSHRVLTRAADNASPSADRRNIMDVAMMVFDDVHDVCKSWRATQKEE